MAWCSCRFFERSKRQFATFEFFVLEINVDCVLKKKKMAKEALRIDFRNKRYGVARWQYEKLDCIDLYMEMLILINCRFIGTCRPCTHLLK